jgi:threonine synthase
MERKNVKPSFSPSMDIQVSSNFERLLFEILDRDPIKVKQEMYNFKKNGIFSIPKEIMLKVNNLFSSYTISNNETLDIIKNTFEDYNYILDPHSAIGFGSARKALDEKIISSNTPIISLACAHPSKFPDIIKKAINIEPQLPEHLKELMVSKEYFKVIDDDTNFIKNYLKQKMRR